MKANRRDFLRKAGTITLGLGLFPTIVKASALGRDGHVAPSERLNMIVIGAGGMGRANMNHFLRFNDVQIVAVCDIDKTRQAEAKALVDKAYDDDGCRLYNDFRVLLEKEKADIAVLSLPDHWHAIISCAVANKKIDIYGEKPMARSLKESRAIVQAVERNNIVWQTGSQQRSEENFRKAAELVRNGRIGKVSYVEVGLPNGGNYIGNPPVMTVPDGVDWDMWLGPAPQAPFRGVLHFHWRWIMDYSGGILTDWAGHHVDIAHWGMGLDETGPLTIKGTGRPHNDGIYNVPIDYDIFCEYANGLIIRVANQSKLEHGLGTRWQGTNGWVHVTRGSNGLKASDESILKEKIGTSEIQLYKSTNHRRNFLDCVRSREETITPAETGHRSISPALLGEIAIITGQKLNWDPVNERFTDNNTYATRLLSRPYREPWTLPV